MGTKELRLNSRDASSANAESVEFHSPGSRSAPWVCAEVETAYPEGVAQRRGIRAARVEPLQGSWLMRDLRTQGALRDPGLWNATPSAYGVFQGLRPWLSSFATSWLTILLLFAAWMLLGCGSSTTPPPPSKPKTSAASTLKERVDESLRKAGEYLVLRQEIDGAWRSDVYGQFKDGPSLTPLITEALYALDSSANEPVITPRNIGVDYLAGIAGRVNAETGQAPRVDPTRRGPGALPHPVYSAALTVIVLSRGEHAQHAKARDAWLAFLQSHQLTEKLGWGPEDAFYGGWGYSDTPPSKPPAGQQLNPLAEPNISATVFALEGLRAAGVPADDAAIQKALTFVSRCQNFRDKDPSTVLDDGGFFFLQNDPDRNKAGAAAEAANRFRSYGSTTADGLRCLLACGLPKEHPRTVAARKWLINHLSVQRQPGDFPKDKYTARDALYYYYCNSLARALTTNGVTEPGVAMVLSEELVRRQKSDGSWQNPVGEIREDDPLIATAFAIGALVRCRAALDEPKP
jgi:hypothetical protein